MNVADRPLFTLASDASRELTAALVTDGTITADPVDEPIIDKEPAYSLSFKLSHKIN
jgi:hypothetical protein